VLTVDVSVIAIVYRYPPLCSNLRQLRPSISLKYDEPRLRVMKKMIVCLGNRILKRRGFGEPTWVSGGVDGGGFGGSNSHYMWLYGAIIEDFQLSFNSSIDWKVAVTQGA
jgi:hypothetical protein